MSAKETENQTPEPGTASVEFLLELLHRTWVHYGMWFHQAQLQLEPDRAVEADQEVFRRSFAIMMKRMASVFGFEVDENGVPRRMLEMGPEELAQAAGALARNWYAQDGVWFQQVEGVYGMASAKRLNDTVWSRYAPYEAERIRSQLGLGDTPGLAGLKAALPLRTATIINRHDVRDESPDSFVLEVTHCRIQEARKRKGLPDYPCRSAGNVEYSYFARALDKRIKVECLGCPPGEHPPEWWCAWRFSLDNS